MPISMDQLDEPFYTAHQIHIPPSLPDILKQYTKAAIRTQPRDLLKWSAAYFRALSNNEIPPVKDRLELQPVENKGGLTQGTLRVLHKLLHQNENVSYHVVSEKWESFGLDFELLTDLMRLGAFDQEFPWINLLALAAGTLVETLTEAMVVLCEILTSDPDGGSASIRFEDFEKIYLYMAEIDGDVPSSTTEAALQYLSILSKKQGGKVMPRNFLSPNCPSLSGN